MIVLTRATTPAGREATPPRTLSDSARLAEVLKPRGLSPTQYNVLRLLFRDFARFKDLQVADWSKDPGRS